MGFYLLTIFFSKCMLKILDTYSNTIPLHSLSHDQKLNINLLFKIIWPYKVTKHMFTMSVYWKSGVQSRDNLIDKLYILSVGALALASCNFKQMKNIMLNVFSANLSSNSICRYVNQYHNKGKKITTHTIQNWIM